MMHLSLEDLDQFQTLATTHLDLEAITGGHISGRRLQGVKINPIFHEQDSSSDETETEQTSLTDRPQQLLGPFHIDVPIHADVYQCLPRDGQHARLIRHQSDFLSHDQHPSHLNFDNYISHSFPRTSYLYSRSRKSSTVKVSQILNQNVVSLNQTQTSGLVNTDQSDNSVITDDRTLNPIHRNSLECTEGGKSEPRNYSVDNSEMMDEDDGKCQRLESISEIKEDHEKDSCSKSLEASLAGLEVITEKYSDQQLTNTNAEWTASANLSDVLEDVCCEENSKYLKSTEQKSESCQDYDIQHTDGDIHYDIILENVLVYSSDADSSPNGDLMAAPSETVTTDTDSDWPDIDIIALPYDDTTQDVITDSKSDIYSTALTNDDPVVTKQDGITDVMDRKFCCHYNKEDNSSLLSNNSNPSPCISSSMNSCRTKPLKPILLSEDCNNSSCAKISESSPSEIKTVTFADGTVFNEDKQKCYQKEKIDLRELYRDRICGKPGLGLINPVFVLSDEDSENEGLTDDEKVKRNSFRINLVNASPSVLDTSSINSDGSSPTINKTLQDLNTPAYMKKYLTQSAQTKKNENSEVSVNVDERQICSCNDIVHMSSVTEMSTTSTTHQNKFRLLQTVVLVIAGIVVIATAVGLGIFFSQRK